MTVSDVDAGKAAPPTRPGRRPRWVVVAGIVTVAAVVAIVVSRWTSGGRDEASETSTTLGGPVQTAIDEAVGEAVAAQSQAVASAFRKVQPSVVEIDIVPDGSVPTTAGGDLAGLGTGVIVNADGTILTAHHVVVDAATIDVVYADGTRSAAEVAAADPERDIAVLRPATLPSVVVPAVLGSEGVGVGFPVVAVGNPLGLDDTTTSGVISALDRTIRNDDGATQRGLIQFDAAVNPGSSGGPLLNAAGEVIGIVVALADPSEDGFFIGIGFAVPIGVAVAAGGGDQPPK